MRTIDIFYFSDDGIYTHIARINGNYYKSISLTSRGVAACNNPKDAPKNPLNQEEMEEWLKLPIVSGETGNIVIFPEEDDD